MRHTSTAERVTRHTAPHVNQRIQRQIEANVHHYSMHPELIDERLRELDEEWDIERAIEANSSALIFVGTALGVVFNRKWFFLPAFVSAFLFQHSVQGWCPPVPIMRRLGLRTAQEIEAERAALKAIRGDFERVKDAPKESKVLAALRAVGRFKIPPSYDGAERVERTEQPVG